MKNAKLSSRNLLAITRKLRVLRGMIKDAEVASLMARNNEERLEALANVEALQDASLYYDALLASYGYNQKG